MAIIEQTIPAKSPTMTEGTLLTWRVKPGDQVKSGQVIAEIQTDKAVVEWEALDGGWVAEILIPAGSQALVNQVAAIFTSKKGEDLKDAVTRAKATNQALAQAQAQAAPAPVAAPMPAPSQASATAPMPAINGRRRVSPLAARLAAAVGIDLSQVIGTGTDGRIVARDIEAAKAAGPSRSIQAKAKPRLHRADGPPVTSLPFSPMRQVIAKRLAESKATIPHFQVTEAVDAGALAALKDQCAAFEGIKVTLNDLVLRAVALALRLHPKLNATCEGGVIRQHDAADLSVAVSIPDGLITPIVRGAHAKTVRQIGDEVRSLAKKAAEGRLQPSEFQGGTFTVSNLGMFGIESFTAIINPPQVAILAVAGLRDEPVLRGGAVVPGKMLRITLSADHRAVDGADAAAFLRTLKQLLEAPAALLL